MSDRRSTVGTLAGSTARTFVLAQEIQYSYSAPVTNLRQRLKVVPPPRHGSQKRGRWSFQVHGAGSSKTTIGEDRFGNVTIDTVVPRVDETVSFALQVETELDGDRLTPRLAPDKRYLQPTRLTAPEPSIRALASGVDYCDVAALCERVYRALAYEWGVTGVHTTAADALAGGRGVCQDYAHVMLAACRVNGIAARYVSGHLTGEGGSHAWVEVLRPDTYSSGIWLAEGWDPTHNRRTSGDYLVVGVGRDYSDVSPMAGTYDGDGVTNLLTVQKQLRMMPAA